MINWRNRLGKLGTADETKRYNEQIGGKHFFVINWSNRFGKLIKSVYKMIKQMRKTDEISWWTNGKTEEDSSTWTTAWRNTVRTYIYINIQLYIYISRVLYCFVLMLIQCWLFPYVFSFFVQKRFLLLTNSYSHKIYTHQVRITFKTRLDLNRDYFRVDVIRFKI